ncbi:MAG: hypothetical protein IJZ68_07675 [Bacteroidaceae bacterium]|nr:hypothetical protein [Bacteroidaceae bacterium]
MGCWNATCNISNLPIFWGDKVVLIPLLKVSSKRTQFNTCYPTDNFVPLGFPIFGEYDDYGRLENAHTSAWNEAHLRQFNYYFEERDDEAEEKYRPVVLKETFDDFVGQVLCCHEGCYIDLPNQYFHPDGKAMVTYMMIHQNVYEKLLEEMAGRIPYNCSVSYRDAFIPHLREKLQELLDSGMKPEECSTPVVYEAFQGMILKDICENIFGYQSYFHQYFIWRDLARQMMNDTEIRSVLLRDIANLKIWTSTLSYLRKGYLCDSGAGGQSSEMRLHLILAQCIKDEVARIRESHEWDEDGDAETIYLW